jgi:hypothetical protein
MTKSPTVSVPRLHADRGHDHHDHKPRVMMSDWPKLRKASERGLDRRLLIALHRAVVAVGLAPFGAEILDRLEVQQAVDGLLVGVGVLLVHLARIFTRHSVTLKVNQI